MPLVLEWSPAVDPSEFVLPVREGLASGQPVVLPGDSGYLVFLNPRGTSAEQHLLALTEVLNAPISLLAYSPEDATALGIEVPLAIRRLMLRAWPAPLILTLPATGAALPPECSAQANARILQDGLIRFRCPDHPALETIVPAICSDGRCGATLVLETGLPSIEAVIERLDGVVQLALAAGELPVRHPTEVLADGSGWRLAREGSFTIDEVERLAARIVLFVCTGNTCRSPLAEGLARKLLSDRLGCKQEELPSRGYWMLSAGVAAYAGGPASPESAGVAREFGADLDSHRSRPVNPQLLAAADDVIAMTRGHAYALAASFPGIGPQPKLLCGDDDLDDPIGASWDVYRECAQTILRHLEGFLPEWTGK
jgi:L-threonylcarbamoyladenylate synthase